MTLGGPTAAEFGAQAPPARTERPRPQPSHNQAQSGVAAPARAMVPQPAAPLDRALLNQYCVTCHNARLKTAGRMTIANIASSTRNSNFDYQTGARRTRGAPAH